MGIYLGANALGGGGEGSGINSYAPFLVGTADNNPQGYIHSTGVYTNPIDESVWLKTGSTVVTEKSTYPNAKYVQGVSLVNSVGVTNVSSSGSMRSTTASLSQLRWYRAYSSPTTNIDVIDMVTSNVISSIDTSVGTTGDVWTVTAIALSYDESEIIAFINIRDTPAGIPLGGYIMKFSTSTFAQTQGPVAAPSSFSLTGSIFNIGNTSWYHNGGGGGNLSFSQIDLSTGILTGNVITTPTTAIGISSDGTYLWYLDNYDKWYQITEAGVLTGQEFRDNYNSKSMIPTATGFRSIQYIGAAPLNMTWDSIITFGDSVARTDSSGSGQPLFIKLK